MIDYNLFNVDNKHGHKFCKRWLNKNQPEILLELQNFMLNNVHLIDLKFNNQLWHLINNSIIIPQCYCRSNNKFINVTLGYSQYCSNKCSANSIETKNKKIKTNLEKYGTKYYTQTDEYFNKNKETCLKKYGVEFITQTDEHIKKKEKTNLEKYGVKHVFQSSDIKEKIRDIKKEKYGNETYNNPQQRGLTLKNKYEDINVLNDFLDKQKATNLKLYGNEFANRTPQIKQKNIDNTKKTLIEKYGVDNVFKIEEIQKNIHIKNADKFKEDNSDLIFLSFNNNTKEHTIKCDKCGSFQINSGLIYTRRKENNEICTNCNPIYKPHSSIEKEICKFIKSLGVEIEESNRNILLNCRELDIFIPSKNIAIEFNGLYWHSEIHVSSNYHLDKTNECEKLGIRLVHIFEDEWLFKKEIVKSRLKNILGLTENKIYARKCVVKNLPTKQSNNFLNDNHIQGSVGGTIKLGLYYNGELVSAMLFIKRNNKKDSFIELNRFCNKLNINVIGAASKLLSYFIKNYKPNKIVSYSDIRWSNGGLYKTLGFNFDGKVPPTYWYVIQTERYHKFNFRKNKIIKSEDDRFKTEHEIMLNNKIYRIYDCGLMKWSIIFDN